MLKFRLALHFRALLVPFASCNCRWDPCKSLLFFIQDSAYTSTPKQSPKNSLLVDYLTESLKFPRSKADAVSLHFPYITTSTKPKAVVCFFRALGLSDTQIQSSVQGQPSILFLDVEKNLKPKVAFFEELGLCGSNLGMLISKNPSILISSLDKKLKPSIGVIKEVLELDGSGNCNNNTNDLMFRVLSRYSWFIGRDSRLRANITYLRSCGVVGSQLIMLLKKEPRLFSLPEAQLKLLVSRATKMGFMIGSRMLAYAILVLYCNTAETINKKFELLQSFGFSKDECKEVFVKLPPLLLTSEAKLRRGIEFFLHALLLDKSAIVGAPQVLTFSMEKRVIPRYKILEIIKSRSHLKREPNYIAVLLLSEKKFVEKYIMRFADDGKVLQVSYENHLLESSNG